MKKTKILKKLAKKLGYKVVELKMPKVKAKDFLGIPKINKL